jgi:hypothetical protein
MTEVLKPLASAALALPLAAQILVVDRPLSDRSAVPQVMERGAEGAYADAFQIGAKGEVWMIDAIRVWAIPAATPACSRALGDQIEKITLFGALDNPPVPGQPVCDCHALVALATAALSPGGTVSANAHVQLTSEKNAWRLDFHDVRWSVPGGMDVLFSVRVGARRRDACPAVAGWSLAAAPGAADHRLHLLNEKGVPIGLEPAPSSTRTVNIQVWARRTQ